MAEDERTALLKPDVTQDARPTSYTEPNGEAPSPSVEGGSPPTDPEGQETPSRPGFKTLLTIVFPMAIGVFLSAMDGTVVASAYASIGSELKQLQKTSWIATAYMLTLTSFQPLYGKLSDIFGRKACLLSAYAIFATGCLFCGLARTMTELVLARALAGVGGGGMSTVTSIIMSDIIPLRSRGTWQGVINIIWATGAATGAPLGGLLADSIGWRWAFLIQVPATIAAIISVSLALHLPKPDRSAFGAKLRRVDFAGSFFLVLFVVALLSALDRGGNVSWSNPLTLGLLGGALVLAVVFFLVETRLAKEPIAPARIIARPEFLFSYLCNLFGMMSVMCITFMIPLYVQAVHRFSAARAGATLLPGILAGVIGSLGAGLIMQATGKYKALTILEYLSLTVGVAVILLCTGVAVDSFVGMSIGLVLGSLGNGGGITSTLIALIANAGTKDQAIATAVSYLFRSLGSVVGVSMSSSIVQGSLRSSLRAKLGDANVDEIVARVRESLRYVEELEPETRAIVRGSYEDALHAAFTFSVSMAAVAFLCSWFIREKPLPSKTGR